MLQFKYEAVVVSVPYVGLGTRLGIAVYTLALLQSPSCSQVTMWNLTLIPSVYIAEMSLIYFAGQKFIP